MTITTKKSANGAKVYYVDGKRVSRDKAIEVAAEQREGNLFTVMAERRFEAPDGTVEIRINEAECKRLETRIGRYMYERDIEVNGEFIIKVYSDDYARAIVDRITEAYLAGYSGCKINVDGTFTIIESEANPADYAITNAALREAVTGEVKAAYAAKLATEREEVMSTPLTTPEAMDATIEGETELASVESTTANVNLYATENELNALLKKVTAGIDDMDVTLQDGNKTRTRFRCAYIRPEYYHKSWLIVTIMGDLWGRYDTPDQVEQVINLLKDAVNRGDKSFKFPTFTVNNGFTKSDIAEIQKDLTEPITAPTDKPEPTIREKMLAIKDELRCGYGRYLGDGRYARQWKKKLNGQWENVSKKVAAAFVDCHGLTLDEFYTEREKWVDEEVARGAAQMAAEDAAQKTAETYNFDTTSATSTLDDLKKNSRLYAVSGKALAALAFGINAPIDSDNETAAKYEQAFQAVKTARDKFNESRKNFIKQYDQMEANIKARAKERLQEISAKVLVMFKDISLTKFATLKAERDAARDKVIETQTALLKAHDAHVTAENDFDAADIAYRYAAIDIAHDLNAKLNLPIDTLDVTTQNGLNWIIALDKVKVTFADDAFKFHCELSDGTDFTLGAYDTPAQAEKVINLLKVALANHHTEFVFLMLSDIDDIDDPDVFKDTRDTLKRAMNIALNHYQGFCYVGNLTAAEYELKLYDLCRKALKEVA